VAICDMHFDHCMSGLAAFASLPEARNYKQTHDGQLIDLAEAKASVARQMVKQTLWEDL